MDDFTDFESVPSAATAGGAPAFGGDDAVNDFLSREAAMKQQLGEDDFFGEPVSSTAVVTTDKFGAGDAAFATQQVSPTGSATATTTAITMSSANLPLGDSEPIRKWKEEQAARIADITQRATKKHEETVARARKEIDQFYDDYNQKKAKQIQRNREQEKTLLKTRDEEGKTVPNFWERTVNQMELNAPATKTKIDTSKSTVGGSNAAASKNSAEPVLKKDTSRMKSLVLQLKNDSKAPGNVVAAR